MKLDEARIKIDEIDGKIVKLYAERMELARQIGLEKAKLGVKILNSAREDEILVRVISEAPEEIKKYVKVLFETLFETSKAYQRDTLDAKI